MQSTGLTITIGCPGSGKSTWADANLPEYCLRLERDRFREALFGSRRAYHECTVLDEIERSALVTKCMVTAMLGWKHDRWALTDTGLAYRSVQPFIDNAQFMGLDIDLVIFSRSREYLQTSNNIRERAHRIPPEILEDRIAEFDSPDAWWRTAPFPKSYA